jgi:hypothetical protein
MANTSKQAEATEQAELPCCCTPEAAPAFSPTFTLDVLVAAWTDLPTAGATLAAAGGWLARISHLVVRSVGDEPESVVDVCIGRCVWEMSLKAL